MARYIKRDDGRYQANVFTSVDSNTGKRKYRTVYARSVPELERKKAEILDQVTKGIYADDKKVTIASWSKKWLSTEKATSGSKTKEMYERLVDKHIIAAIGNIRLRDLKKSDIQKMINDRAKHPRTCQQLKMCINQILESAIEDGLLYKNVCRNINMPYQIKEEKRALTEIEKKSLTSVCLSDKERAFVNVIQYCGLRRGEALALSRNDIDFNENVIKIRNVVVFENSKAVLKSIPKSIAGIRAIPMPTILADTLKLYLPTLNGLYLFEMERKPGLMTKSSYDKFFKKIVEKINIAAGGDNEHILIHNLGAHVFRHNYATMLFYAGIDIKEAQYLLGHTDVRLTLNIYTHLEKGKTTAASKLDTFLASNI